MKKIFILFLAIMLLSLSVFAAGERVKNDNMEVGFSSALVSWAFHDNEGNIKGYRGISSFLGYQSSHYFGEFRYDKWNPYWHWGTAALVIPYIGLGTEYIAKDGYFFGVGLTYVVPYMEFGVRF